MIIDGDGHFFETEEMFEKCMEPSLKNYRPRLLKDDQGYNFWVVDGQTPYKRPSIKGAGAPGTAAPPGKSDPIGAPRFRREPDIDEPQRAARRSR